MHLLSCTLDVHDVMHLLSCTLDVHDVMHLLSCTLDLTRINAMRPTKNIYVKWKCFMPVICDTCSVIVLYILFILTDQSDIFYMMY